MKRVIVSVLAFAVSYSSSYSGIAFLNPEQALSPMSFKMIAPNSSLAYIDDAGRVVIDLSRFRGAGSFSGGLAPVLSADHRWGFINETGEIVIESQFEQAHPFADGLAGVQVEGKCGFIDSQGRLIIKPIYEHVNSFAEGLAVVVRGESTSTRTTIPSLGRDQSAPPTGLVMSQSKIVTSVVIAKSESAEAFENKKADVIDKDGHTVLSMNLSELQPNLYEGARFSEGLMDVTETATNKVGFIDKTGRFVIPPTFDEAAPFSEGLARVTIRADGNERVGFINHEGRFVIPPKFNTDGDFKNSQDFSDGLAGLTENLRPTITEGEKYAFIDRRGAIALMTNFFYAGPFRGGLAPAYDGKSNKWGYIDKSGKIVIPIQYSSAASFSGGLALVEISDK